MILNTQDAYTIQVAPEGLVAEAPKHTKGMYAQQEALLNLIERSKNTEFGKKYGFDQLLASDSLCEAYRQNIPIFQYEFMFKKFWHETFKGVPNVSWPGKISNYIFSSGSCTGKQKKIPLSEEMMNDVDFAFLKQLNSLRSMKLPKSFYKKDVIFVGGDGSIEFIHSFRNEKKKYTESGLVSESYYPFMKYSISSVKDAVFEERLTEVALKAKKYDVGVIYGSPFVVEQLIRRINELHSTESIFETWPNLRIFIHGGASFTPYMCRFNNLFQEQVVYLEIYQTAEGLIGYQSATESQMRLNIDGSNYYEFIPVDADHFDMEGNLINYSDACLLNEVIENKEYAIILSSNNGTFRYLLGDRIRFTDLSILKFKICGRIKDCIDLCGENLSVDHMTEAISTLTFKNGHSIKEFTVCGRQNEDGKFVHKWYLGGSSIINKEELKYALDAKLCELSGSYRFQRSFDLENLELEILPSKYFEDYLVIKDRHQSKSYFPRVIKGKAAYEWEKYLDIIDEENARALVYWQSGKTTTM